MRMPVEKLRLRPWLENVLNTGRIPGVKWLDSRDKVFQVSWKHASRQGWNLDTDAGIFKEWAVHTGRFRQQCDKPDPRRWKANFRCALNALPDIKELQARGVTRGNNAFKVYQMLAKPNEQTKDRNKANTKDADSKVNQSKVISKYNKGVIPTTAPVIQRHSVIHKSSTVFQHSDSSRHAICTTHPVNPQSLIPYWPTYTTYSPHPHMKDHDYLTTWFDPRPEMRDIGVMTYQDIKKEPGSPDNRPGQCCQNYDQDAVVSLTDSHYINNVKEEETISSDEDIPDDQEIIDLVDQMSRDSDTASHCSGASYDEYENEYQEAHLTRSPRSTDTRPTSLTILKPSMHTEEYMMMYGYQSNAPPPPLTPESASEILKGITAPVNQSA